MTDELFVVAYNNNITANVKKYITGTSTGI